MMCPVLGRQSLMNNYKLVRARRVNIYSNWFPWERILVLQNIGCVWFWATQSWPLATSGSSTDSRLLSRTLKISYWEIEKACSQFRASLWSKRGLNWKKRVSDTPIELKTFFVQFSSFIEFNDSKNWHKNWNLEPVVEYLLSRHISLYFLLLSRSCQDRSILCRNE